MNGFEAIAASLADLADWSEDAVAGGKPPRWVVQETTERTRQLAFMARLAGDGKMAPAVLAGILRGDDGGGETLTLGRPGLQPSGKRRGWRAVRQVRAVLVSAGAAVRRRLG